MNSLVTFLNRSPLLREDLDYHLVRASMVIIFLFFGYQKWFEYEAQVLISVYQQRSSHLLDVSGVRRPRSQLVPGCFGMANLRPFVLGLLG